MQQRQGSHLEDVLKTGTPGSPAATAEAPALKSALETELDQEDKEIAKELQRSRAEEIIAMRRQKIAVLTGMNSPQNTGNTAEQGRPKEYLVNIAEGLLSKGLDPERVGRMIDYLLSGGSAASVALPGMPMNNGGLTLSDMKELFRMGQESNRADPGITGALAEITKTLAALQEKINNPPPANRDTGGFIMVDADGNVKRINAGEPIVIRPKADPAKKSVEEIREENRHKEEMVKIEGEKTYKANLAETLATLPETIGKGIASMTMNAAAEEAEAGVIPAAAARAAGTGGMESTTCQEEGCGSTIVYPPEALQITCPKCGMTYKRTPKENAGNENK